LIWFTAILIIRKLLQLVMKRDLGLFSKPPKTALDILYERYTREDISRQEYDRLRKELLENRK